MDFTIDRDFPELEGVGEELFSRWFHEVCRRTAVMLAHWMGVGFVHGVMNTDNMSILGLTIDYGPYGWLENFDPNWTPKTTDAVGRRYRFGHQPRVAQWNLARLGSALLPLFSDQEPLQQGLELYTQTYSDYSAQMTAAKFGFLDYGDLEEELVADTYRLLHLAEVDMTIFFRRLGSVGSVEDLQDAFYDQELYHQHRAEFQSWFERYQARLQAVGESADARLARMNKTNPVFVLRNYLAQLAIDEAENGSTQLVTKLLDRSRDPYREWSEENFAEKRPEWARNRPGCSMLSCSS